jgi:hypothetical protein
VAKRARARTSAHSPRVRGQESQRVD